MSLATARYEAERRSVGAVVAAVGLSLFAGLFLAIGPSLIAEIDIQSYAAAMPPAFQAAFNLSAMGSFAGLLATELYQFGWVILLGIYFAYLGGGSVAGDVESGRADMLLSTPLSRGRLVAEKFLALMWPMLVVNAVVGLVVYLGAMAINETLPLGDILAVHALSLPYLLVATALGVLASTVADSASLAQRLSAGLMFALFLLESSVANTDYEWLGILSPSRYYDPTAILVSNEYDLTGAVGMIVATAVLLGLARFHFRRRDL
jgi:ABC-2 type transport system permease protein